MKIAESSKYHTTFVTRLGTLFFEVVPFGLINFPETFLEMIYHLLEDLPFSKAYLYDVMIHSKEMRDHLKHLRIFVDLLQMSELKLLVSNCTFYNVNMALLGNMLSNTGAKTDRKKIGFVFIHLFKPITLAL